MCIRTQAQMYEGRGTRYEVGSSVRCGVWWCVLVPRTQRRLWGGWWTIREIQRDRLIPPTRRGNAARHVHLGRAGSAERFRSGRHGAHAPFQRLSRTLAASARELRQRGCDRARPPYEAP